MGLPENTNSQFISWCLTTLFNKGLQGTATNLWVKKTEIAAFPKSEGILSVSLLLDCNMLCSSRAGNVSQAHENRLGLLTAHVHGTHKPLSATHSPSHPTAAPTQVRGKKNCGEKISPQALNPAALVLHRHTSDSPFYLCTLPLFTTALISVHVFSWSFLTPLPLPFPCPVLIVAYKSSKLFHAREIPD